MKRHNNLVGILSTTVDHFFPKINKWFAALTDIRNQKIIEYKRETLIWVMLITLLTRQGARSQIQKKMRGEEKLLQNLKELCGQEELAGVPHGDTVEYLSMRMKPKELEEIIVKMVQSIIRGRGLEKNRLNNKYYTVAIDGVHLYTFDYPHCDKCLVKEDEKGKKQWFHYKLQASLVTPTGLCLPMASEWIENEENYNKQDCELKAFYRLIKKLRQYYPQLPMCILLDSLYAADPVFQALAKEKMEWIIVFKKGSMPEVYSWLMSLQENFSDQVVVRRVEKEIQLRQRRTHSERLRRSKPVYQQRTLVKETTYTWFQEDHWDGKRSFTIITCKEVKDGNTNCEYVWLVSAGLNVSKKNVVELAENGGRCRWKIENEGINVQKNGGYQLEHRYSTDEISMKNWIYMMDIAHVINQLIENGSLIRKEAYGSFKNIAHKLFEHFCYYLFEKPAQRLSIQIRLCWDTT